ncbi:uncharacterized protein CTHT_0021890 [Thermochaetoides thermophila DSM 1495]|uniref:Uncharacterized protein n=1 Tax=Chaetomium thermophilum (strain DSM 1495 / CBS 144.50 / IMI 039719) TaxID=759272 RepID=G0S3N5_CHATD|nr:hypothetical protein CTHT_0021890 [Thermochaetoides thermophila DSM 1495]EGS20362.1 hypothetical protein CTHT_0021890 [Thermochaetoides thermophila DSM 1495]
MQTEEFWKAFLHSRIIPFSHEEYLRAAYLTLIRSKNRRRGLLDIATEFAENINNLRKRSSQITLPPVSRTLTVFWLYHVRLAIRAMEEHEEKYDYKADGFGRLKNYLPALFNPELHKKVREQLFKVANNNEPGHDPERVLRFSFYVVRRYLRPRESRSRNIILKYAFASLEKYLIRLRTKHKAASPYSLTQTYFFIQLVHAALAQLASHRHANFVQDLSFPLFKQISGISSTSWQDYYSEKLWNSFEARASFVFPDLKPLPDTVTPFADLSRNDFKSRLTDEFLDVGLIPELPPLEVLHFYQDLFMATVPSLPERMSPAGVTSYETLSNPPKYLKPDQHPQLYHTCSCHLFEPFTEEALATIAARTTEIEWAYERYRKGDSFRNPTVSPRVKGSTFEQWLTQCEGHLLIAYDESWRAFLMRKQWEGEVELKKRGAGLGIRTDGWFAWLQTDGEGEDKEDEGQSDGEKTLACEDDHGPAVKEKEEQDDDWEHVG